MERSSRRFGAGIRTSGMPMIDSINEVNERLTFHCFNFNSEQDAKHDRSF